MADKTPKTHGVVATKDLPAVAATPAAPKKKAASRPVTEIAFRPSKGLGVCDAVVGADCLLILIGLGAMVYFMFINTPKPTEKGIDAIHLASLVGSICFTCIAMCAMIPISIYHSNKRAE